MCNSNEMIAQVKAPDNAAIVVVWLTHMLKLAMYEDVK